MGTGDKMLGVTCDGLASYPAGGEQYSLLTSCYGNRDKLWQCGPVGPSAALPFTTLSTCTL